jgi:hypothetical protein
VAIDISRVDARRLRHVDGLSIPRGMGMLVERRMTLERRLANVYASGWIGIYDVIAAARASARRRATSEEPIQPLAARRSRSPSGVPPFTHGQQP